MYKFGDLVNDERGVASKASVFASENFNGDVYYLILWFYKLDKEGIKKMPATILRVTLNPLGLIT
ncbi:hypothetical protein [Halalkalibacter lacteus]|uniref:hypothetical protein n=1 Tax=Halalkalibacter lacteus TaxID=3090663 RepID=UPI002FCA549A